MESLQHFFTHSPVDAASFSHSLWLIIALPMIGALVCGVAGRAIGRANTHLVACAAVAGSFVLSVIAFWSLNDPSTVAVVHGTPMRYALWFDYGRWFGAGSFWVDYGLLVDHLSGILLLVITGVGLLIHIYSTSYMSHDDGYWRFFAYLNLFVAMMLTLVMGDSLVLLFVGWEGVGFCSYLLIGFWYTDEQKAFAGRKAFITNRVGDFAFIIGMILTVLFGSALQQDIRPANFHNNPMQGMIYHSRLQQMGPLDVTALSTAVAPIDLEPQANSAALSLKSTISHGPLQGKTYGGVLTAILLLFMLGASGKSAQIPLYVWLPDAMAGPTPVSALIHAATMVTAGVYMFSRLSFLLVLSPAAMAVVALIGAGTALLAALIAFAQDDIKKVLAYSTVSQLGFMFMAVGVGAFWAAVLHLVTHAFFKACLFLGAGSVMHGNHDETNIKKLGGLRKEMPWTWITFLIATLAITGIVPLSGFFSKDAILGFVHRTELAGLGWVTPTVWIVGLIAAFCTAFYMSRVYLLTFEGERAPDALVPHAHESDWPMTMPLVVLAFLSIAAVAWGIPFMTEEHQTVMENFTAPVFAQAQIMAERAHSFLVAPEGEPFWSHWVGPLFLAWGIALAGGAAAAFLYLRFFPARKGQPAPAFARTVQRWAVDKFYVDELYDLVVLRPVKALARGFYRVIDDWFIDSFLVRGTARVTVWAGSALRYVQTGDVQSYAAVMAVALLAGVVYVLVVVL